MTKTIKTYNPHDVGETRRWWRCTAVRRLSAKGWDHVSQSRIEEEYEETWEGYIPVEMKEALTMAATSWDWRELQQIVDGEIPASVSSSLGYLDKSDRKLWLETVRKAARAAQPEEMKNRSPNAQKELEIVAPCRGPVSEPTDVFGGGYSKVD